MRNRGIPEGWSADKASKETPAPQQISSGKASFAPKWQGWLRRWVFWAVLTGSVSSGIGFVAVTLLLKLPAAPNCPSIFWPLASASVRLHCAQVAASKQTVDDLLEAIALVRALPSTHPLHQEINGFLEQWSLDILELADEAFQAGELQKAIAITSKIPQDIPAAQQVKQRVSLWQSMWSEAEAIYQQAEVEMREQHWHQAFMVAVRLLNIGNNYWATTKYEELNHLIETARDDGNKLAKAQGLANRGGLNNLLAALKLVEPIDSKSYIYKDAQKAIIEFGREMLVLGEAALNRQNADEAIIIANQIPTRSNLDSEVEDFITLVEAWRSAWVGTIPNLEQAMVIVQKIGVDRPSYNKAQELISRWQLEITDIGYLDQARELAKGGTVADLTSAIAEAELIPDSNPRAGEAKQEINRWRGQVETIEDRPYLDRAEELAIWDNINSLQAAINEASQISSERALYQEAQTKIRDWTSQIQRIEDQPYLDQARLLANNGDLPAAIAAAQQIRPRRALSSEAQATVNDWESQIQARQNWQLARRLAVQGTPDALAEAINLARRVPRTSPLRIDVNPALEQWSQQMLGIALDRGKYDIPGGIALANQIPPGTDAYKAAQDQIRLWQLLLNPPAPPATPTPSTSPIF